MVELDAEGRTFPHQLLIHSDVCGPQLSVAYSYPFSSPPLSETRVSIEPSNETEHILRLFARVGYACLETFAEPYRPARLPHAVVPPEWRLGCLTVVFQDYRRATELPMARLYLNEVMPQFHSQVEHSLTVRRDQVEPGVELILERLRAWAKGVAWQDYEDRFRAFFRD